MSRPKILEAIAKKIDSSLTGTALDTFIDNMVKSVESSSPLEVNQWIETMFNKVLRSVLNTKVLFNHPLISHYINLGEHITEFTEVFETKNTKSHEYDASVRIPNDRFIPKTLHTVIGKGIKRYIAREIQYDFIKQVFATPDGAASWLSDTMNKMSEDIRMDLYDYIVPRITTEVKNTIDLTTYTSPDEFLIALNTLTDKMGLKTNAFNLGFTSQVGSDGEYISDGSDDETMINTLSRENMLIIASPQLFNILDGKVSTVKFHNEYFNIKKYGAVAIIEAKHLYEGGNKDKPFLMVLDKNNAFKGWYQLERVATQNYAASIKSDIFSHYWFKFGPIPWANGVKVLYNKDILK